MQEPGQCVGWGLLPTVDRGFVPLIWGHMDMGCDLSHLMPGKWAMDQYNLIKSWQREGAEPPAEAPGAVG